jgi:uncharacterized membrane protein YhaH (DUF805 family)
MKLKDSLVNALENWNNFTGRASRGDYWYYQLGLSIISVIVLLVVSGLGMVMVSTSSETLFDITLWLLDSAVLQFLLVSMYIVLVVTNISLTIRRFHDMGKSGWWCVLVLLLPIPFIFWLAIDGTAGDNKYGQDPKIKVE